MTSEPTAEPASGPPIHAGPIPRAVIVLLGMAGAVGVIVGLRLAAELVGPILLALMLTMAVTPLLGWARRRGWPGWAGTGLAMLAVYGIVVFLVVGLSASVVKLVELVPEYASSADRLRGDLEGSLADAGVPAGSLAPALDQLDLDRLTTLLVSMLSSVLGVLGNLVFLIALLFFFCAEAAAFRPRMAVVRREKPALAAAFARYQASVQRYLVVTAVFGGIVAVLDSAALWLMGIPLPLLWGLFSFLTNFIPNVGFVIGVIPPALLALLERGWTWMVLVVVVYSTLNVIIQTFIQPRFVGESVGLSTTVAFLSVVVWAFVLGPLGALLSVPMTLLVIAIFLDPDPRARWSSALIAFTPEVAPAEAAPAPPIATPDGARPTASP